MHKQPYLKNIWIIGERIIMMHFIQSLILQGAGSINSFIAKTTGNTTDYYLQDASYLRLKNLTVSYDLPKGCNR